MNQLWDATRSLLRARREQPPLEAAPRDGAIEASFAQARLWFLDQLRPDTAYHLAVACRLRGRLDVPALERSLTELVRRHEILRTTLRMEGRLLQQIAPAEPFRLRVEPVEDLEIWTEKNAGERLDLARGPLFRASLAQLGPQDHCLLLVLHHAICDAWSFEILMRELSALYAGRELPETLQYADFARWQRRCDQTPHLQYWRQKLSGELPRLPADRPATTRPAGTRTMTLPSQLTTTLKSLAAGEGATLYMVLLAAFYTLLYRYTGEEDLIIGSPFAGRNHPGLGGVVGLFTNTLPLRVDLSGQPSFRQLLARVRETVTGALAHQDVPLEQLVRELRPQRRADASPLFEAMFALQNVPRAPWQWPELSVEAWNVKARHAKVDVALTMQETPEGLRALLEHDADGFHPPRWLEHFSALLNEAVRDPEQRIGELPLPCESWGCTATPYPQLAVHRVFEAQARRTPNAVALAGDETLTYAELNRRANQLAHRIAKLQLGAEALVAICLPRSASFIVAQLAILKAGCAYVPVDDSNLRGAGILKKVAAVVSDRPWPSKHVLIGDLDERDHDLDEPVAPDRLAYVMLTSGSTGAPRGVAVAHRGIVRLVKGQSYARFASDEVFLQLAPLFFDAATFEVWGALLHGAKLVMAPARPLAIAEIGALIRRHRVTTLWLTSGLFELFVDGGLEQLTSLRQLLTGGDVMSVPHARRFLQRMKHCRLINGYGPTENTTFTCAHAVESVESEAIPIGRPIANTSVQVLDARLQPVPDGVPGEAYAGGDGLARGYLDDEAATNERFMIVRGERLYRTGDRVRRRADGTLEFLGRVDHQLKLRGVRVDPAEVERVVRQGPGVSAAAVMVVDKRLVAYVVSRDDQLRGWLRRQLPDAMIPSLVRVDQLPLGPSGKLDRRALLLPRDALEEKLAALFAPIVGSLGIHDSFFDAGGDSLSAMRLLAEIERELGPLPLAILFEKPTIAELAGELRRRSTAPSDGLVSIKHGHSPMPLFVIAGGRGGKDELNLFAKLSGRLDGQTVYGLLVPDARSVEAIAETCILNLRRVQPRGPYRLAGECVGGMVAWEMAQQLSASGEKVELLLLVDSWPPTGYGVIHHRLLGHPLALLKLGIGFLAGLRSRSRSAEPWPLELWRRAMVPSQAKRYIRACMRYRPRRYSGRVTLLACDESLRRGIAPPWQRLAAELTIRRAPGDHLSYVRQYAEQTAEQLRLCVEGAA